MDGLVEPMTAVSNTANELEHVANTVGHAENDRQFVRVEANFLRLPLFALDNKNMRTMDAIHCEGAFRQGENRIDFSFQASRNVHTLYPGPLARSAHFAILTIATQNGLPIINPVTFTWGRLCAIMGVKPSGSMIAALRDAITATKGLMIESRSALFSKAANHLLSSDEQTHVFSLYDEVEFHGVVRSDGTKADANAVRLSRWYADNLNALYSGPLDYRLWRALNEKSPIASRLYEFLFFKFFGRDFLRFNYSTVVKFLPARTERFLSHAQKQLGPPLYLLIDSGVLETVQWVSSVTGSPQLLFRRGPALAGMPKQEDSFDVDEDEFSVRNVEQITGPETDIVKEFHRLWGNDNFKPSKAELAAGRDLIARYGANEIREVLPAVAKRMRVKWPDAKTFVGAARYVEEVAQETRKRRALEEQSRVDEVARETERRNAVEEAKEQAALKVAWESLKPEEREEIRTIVLANQPPAIAKHPGIVERWCLAELAKRFG